MSVPQDSMSQAWAHMESITIKQAACLLSGFEPQKYFYSAFDEIPPCAQSMSMAIAQAIFAHKLSTSALYVRGQEGKFLPGSLDDAGAYTDIGDSTSIHTSDLAMWCDTKAIQHPWHFTERYPEELRAAVEAFEAVSRDPSATAKRSPKAALVKWLEKNKPELSSNARERIATVANWQPIGGAPKTLGD